MPKPRRTTSPATSGATINAVNLRDNVLPTRERATLVLEKGDAHRVERMRLRKL